MATTTQAAAPLWTPNTSIINMPNEVLREIFLSINGEFSRTLYSLSLTCKHFRNIVEEHCEPEYNLRGKWIEDPYPLMERIWAHPYLRRVLRVLRMEYNFMEFTKHTEERVQALVSSMGLIWTGDEEFTDFCDDGLGAHNGGPIWLCLLLPKVETIELSTKTANPRTSCVPLVAMLHDLHIENLLRCHRFKDLRNLYLAFPPESHDGLTFEAVCPSNFVYPNLKKAKLFNCVFDEEGWEYCTPKRNSVSPVTDLEIHEYQASFADPAYVQSWSRFKHLKTLRLHVEYTYLFYDDQRRRPRYSEALSLLANSLEDLQLYSNERYQKKNGKFAKMSPHCPAQPSFRHLSRLRSLALTDVVLVGVSTAGPTHWHQSARDTVEDLVQMFPTSLETFTHLLWDGPTSFSGEFEPSLVWKSVWESVWKSLWCYFPSLSKVMVQKYGLQGLTGDHEVLME